MSNYLESYFSDFSSHSIGITPAILRDGNDNRGGNDSERMSPPCKQGSHC